MLFEDFTKKNIFYTMMKNIAYKKCQNDDSMIKVSGSLFYFLGKDNTRIKTLHSLILNNIFMPDEIKDNVFTIFSHTQRLYKIINKFVYKYNFKKIKIMNDTDMFLTDLDNIKSHLKITIKDNNALYVFKLGDLSNMISKALSRSTTEMFTEPIEIKNPYNNIPFSKANLYNIYFAIKQSSFSLPILFQLYFNHEFNFQKFCDESECLTKDISIENHVKQLPPRHLYYKCLAMLSDASYFGNLSSQIKIHKDFPKSVVMDTFKPYLIKYYHSKYSINPQKRVRNKQEVLKKLKVFREENPRFGRKNISINEVTQDSYTNAFIFGQSSGTSFETSVKNNYHEIDISRTDVSSINRRSPARILRQPSLSTPSETNSLGNFSLAALRTVRRYNSRGNRQDRINRIQRMNGPLPTPRDGQINIIPHITQNNDNDNLLDNIIPWLRDNDSMDINQDELRLIETMDAMGAAQAVTMARSQIQAARRVTNNGILENWELDDPMEESDSNNSEEEEDETFNSAFS